MMPQIPMNNPVFQLISLMRSGGNPIVLLNQMAQNNPSIRQFMQMINGKDNNQLREIAERMARECGTTVNDIANQLGISVPR